MDRKIALLFSVFFISSPSGLVAKPGLTPNEVVASASPADWKEISTSDLLVMELAADSASKQPRRVVMQLMPAPFSQGWIRNIRRLSAAAWWKKSAIVRVQDNYVVQWGDPDAEDSQKAAALPANLERMHEVDYVVPKALLQTKGFSDAYAKRTGFIDGWPVAGDDKSTWPAHCYGALGVGRNLSPDAGSGAELYVVIGHAPRHLDRNIAVVGRVIDGMEHLTSLPRGSGPLGFYESENERVAIKSIQLMRDIPAKERIRYAYLDTKSDVFRRYVQVRANRKDAFYFSPAGGVDLCNVQVPIRKQ